MKYWSVTCAGCGCNIDQTDYRHWWGANGHYYSGYTCRNCGGEKVDAVERDTEEE